jgi:hypothetical protein
VDLRLSEFIFNDFFYCQNPDGSYIFGNDGDFQLADRNAVIDTILSTLEKMYKSIVIAKKINPGRIECNVYLLDKVLTRYSRDIFGEPRLQAKIENLTKLGRITSAQADQLSRFSDYGLKTDTCAPYIHRQLSVLLYWLSVLKPFAIYTDGSGVEQQLGVAFEFHNEYMSYLLCLSFLKVFNCSLDIHANKDFFYDFLYDLHFRNLSRSSLEFFLYERVVKISKSKEETPER